MSKFLVNPRPAIRVPTVDAPLTAITTLRQTLAVKSPNPGDGTLSWNAGDLISLVIGQPGCTAITGPVYIGASATTAAEFSTTFVTSDGSSTSSSWSLCAPAARSVQPAKSQTQPTTPWPLASVVGGTSSYLAAAQAKQKPIGFSMGKPFVMMSGFEELYVSASSGSATDVASYQFALLAYTGPDQPPNSQILNVAANGSGLVPVGQVLTSVEGNKKPTFYCIEFVGLVGSSSTTPPYSTCAIELRFRNTTACYMWAQLYSPDLDVDPAMGLSCRRTSCAFSLQNTSALINRQGTVLAARQPFNDFRDFNPSVLSNATQRYFGDAAKGLYTYLEFTAADEEFMPATNEYGGVIFNLDSNDMVHLIQVSCPAYATAPNSYALILDIALEFRTQSQRFSLGVSRLSHGELIAARRIANLTPWFFECESEDPGKVVSKVLQAWKKGVGKRDFI